MEAKMPGGNGDGRKKPPAWGKRSARERKPHRMFDAQRPRREAEASARREAVKVARWISSNGGKLEEAARLIGVPVRTLRSWRANWKETRLVPRLRGRRAEKLDYRTRTAPTDHDTLQDIRFLLGSRKSGRLLRTARSGYVSISAKQINDIVAKCGRLAGVSHPNPEESRLKPHLFRLSPVR